jgi:hypothetical protein
MTSNLWLTVIVDVLDIAVGTQGGTDLAIGTGKQSMVGQILGR